jgi:hypothetical protein
MNNALDEALYAVSEFGTLWCEQVYRLIKLRGGNHPENAVNYLLRHKNLYKNNLGYLSTTNTFSNDNRVTEAFDILLEFIGGVEPRNYFNAKMPAQIVFVKKGIAYEICVLHKDDYELVSLFNNCNRGDDAHMIFIVGIDNINDAKKVRPPGQNKMFYAVRSDGKIEFFGG